MTRGKHINILTLFLVTAMLAQLTIGCKSDDDTPDKPVPGNGETLTQADSLVISQQMAVVNILSTLTGRNDIGADFDTRRYEPDYGTVRDEALPYVRAVAVADAAQAENQFLALGGAAFAVRTPDGLKVTLADMNLRTDGRRQTLGTLTFHRVADGERLAYADVEIACLPTLRRIEYIDETNWGSNAKSAYMLGQLVNYTGNSFTTGLYVCVKTSTDGANNGRLIHFEKGPGASDCSYNLDGDKEGCWVPFHPGAAADMECYTQLMMRNKRGYRNAIKRYLERSSTDEKFRNRIDHVLPEGFRKDGYLYYGNGMDFIAILNAEYSSESEWIFGRRRKVTTWRVSNKSVSNYGEEWIYTYWYDDEWGLGFERTYTIHTMNIIKFGSSEVAGAAKVYDPAPDAF